MRTLDIKVRGIYIALACDIERTLSDIISLCEISDFDKRSEFKFEQILHLEMGKKLTKCKKSLERYNVNYYNEYKQHLERIDILVEYRNVLAHGFSEYDPNEKDDETITYYNKEKSRLAKYVIKPKAFIMNLKDFHSVILQLNDLVGRLARERGSQSSLIT